MNDLDPRIRSALQSVNPTTEHPAWHGCPSALGVLRGVSPAVAVWRPYPGANNIREIALHLAFCENGVANRLSGSSVLAGFKQRKSSWAIQLDAIDAAQWKSELELVKTAHQRLVAAVMGFDPGKLDQPAGRGSIRSAVECIHGVAEHSLYHTAQMEAIKTLARHQDIQ
jgi:DinB superfamily